MGNPKNIPVALESLICGLVCHRLPAKHPNKRNALRHGNRSLKKEQLQGELWKGAARPTQCVDSCSCCCCTARAWLANDLCSHIPLQPYPDCTLTNNVKLSSFILPLASLSLLPCSSFVPFHPFPLLFFHFVPLLASSFLF